MKEAFNMKAIIAGLFGVSMAAMAQAQNTYSNGFVTISNLVFYSGSDTIYPQYAGAAVVSFAAPVTWVNSTGCASTAVAIRAGDKTLITAVETALAIGRPIQVFVDDAQTVDGVVCWLRAVEM